MWLFILPMAIACATWTVTHEELFQEPRNYCKEQSERAERLYRRKFFYVFTCEYCFSHYVTALCLIVTRYQLLYQDWRGYLLAFFALAWIANQYMSIYSRLRLDIRHERIDIKEKEQDMELKEAA